MRTVEEALDAILQGVQPLSKERVLLRDTLGRVLAEEIAADINVPPFDNSAVDGYAVRSEDTQGASPTKPVFLRTLGDVPAGATPTETVLPGTAARIMTGAPLPPGADAVVMVEDTLPPTNGRVGIQEAASTGQHVRRSGEDVARGSVVLTAGTRIRAAEVAMLAAMGRARVSTVRPARVAVVSTGDEVVDILEGVAPPAGKIRNSNRYALTALTQEAGAIVHTTIHLPDDLTATIEAFRLLAHPETGADVIVTAGGVSVGDRDFVKPALEALGTLELWKVAMKPGKPLAFGHIGRTLFFGLPGNPVSAFVTYELFVRPALWKLAGHTDSDLARRQVQAIITESIEHIPGRREYVRAITTQLGDQFVTRPTGAQGSGILHSLILANSLLILPTDSPGVEAGETVTVLLLD